MIAAEAGWVTLGVFFSMLLYFYFRNIRNIFKLKNHSARYIAVAFLGALTQIYIQTTLEWVIKQTNNFYQLMLVFALIATISRIVETRKESAQSVEPVSPSDNPGFAHRQEELIKPVNSKPAYLYREVPCVSNI
jgi:exopolyphosphatase/pppGpp-phosphohydrolase